MVTTIFSFEIKQTEDSKKIQAVLKALGIKKIKIEKKEIAESDVFYPELQKKIDQSREDKKEGKLLKIDPSNLWENIH